MLMAMYRLAISYDEAGRRDRGAEAAGGGADDHRKVSGKENADTLWVMHNLADSYDAAGRRDEALKLREEALPLLRKAERPRTPRHALGNARPGDSYDEAGRLDEALKLREEVLPLRRKVSGPEHPDTLWAMRELATFLQRGWPLATRRSSCGKRCWRSTVSSTARNTPTR